MNEHDFSTIVSAIRASRTSHAAASDTTDCDSPPPQNLPTWKPSDWPTPDLEVSRLRIGLPTTSQVRRENHRARYDGQPLPHPYPPDDEHNYWAEAIRWGQRYFYCVGNTLIECDATDYGSVNSYPDLRYFSCAIPLHHRIQQVKDQKKLPSDFYPGKDSWGRRNDPHIISKIAASIEEVLKFRAWQQAKSQQTASKTSSTAPEDTSARSDICAAITEVLEKENRYLAHWKPAP